jgi:hypothetical protein
MSHSDTHTVVTEALRDEAKKWATLSDELGEMAARVGRLTLDSSAFFCGDASADVLSADYDTYLRFMIDRFTEGRMEYLELARALKKAAAMYDESDADSARKLSAIYGTAPELSSSDFAPSNDTTWVDPPASVSGMGSAPGSHAGTGS